MSTSDPFQLLDIRPIFTKLGYEYCATGEYLNAKFNEELNRHIVAYLPHVGDAEGQKPRGTHLCNSSAALPSHVLPPLTLLHTVHC
jgi:hypothetical protein